MSSNIILGNSLRRGFLKVTLTIEINIFAKIVF